MSAQPRVRLQGLAARPEFNGREGAVVSRRLAAITGQGAIQLSKVLLEQTSITDFCGIPLVSLRDNSITELNLEKRGVGLPGAIVLSQLLPSATALTSLKFAACPGISLLCHQPLTCACTAFGSLADNRICGVNEYGEGYSVKYTTEGINALCEALKSATTLTSLKYASQLESLPIVNSL